MASAAMSDSELQRKLLEYGEPDIPITDSTRSLLLKRLKKLQSDRSQVPKRKSLFNLSSDESESENASAAILTRSNVNSGPRRSSRRLSKGSTSNLESNSAVSTDESDLTTFVQPRRPMRRSLTTNEINSSFSKKSTTSQSSPRHSVEIPSRYQRRSLTNLSSKTSSSRNIDSGSDSDISDSSISNIPENHGVDEFPRSRRSMVSPFISPMSGANNKSEPTVTGATKGRFSLPSSTPWRRRSAPLNSFGKTYSEQGTATDITKVHANGHHDFIDSVSEFEGGFAAESSPNNSQCISMILVGTLALFFVIVGLIYLGARHKDPDVVMQITAEENLREAISTLKGYLRIKAGNAECNSSSLPSDKWMSVKDAERLVTLHKGVDFSDVLAALSNNKQSGVRLLDESYKITQVQYKVEWLESTVIELSFLCRIQKALRNTFYKVSVGLAGLSISLGVIYIIYWLWTRRQQERKEVFVLVERILEILQNHHRSCRQNAALQPFLAIPHVRDMLIPPTERKSKRGVWDGAVHFIQNNESRVRFETQAIEGEDFLVWRWVQQDPPNGANQNGNKTVRIWQGQAFENLETGMNALPCSPTPCLKVRNMFDPDVEYEDDWPVHIRDAILEKCSDANIVHMRVDPLSREGCVYIKCQNSEMAGYVYKALHGWWFDGKLITVKYLRLERYHERFPESVNCTKTLTPSIESAVGLTTPATFPETRMRLRSGSNHQISC